MSRRTNFRLAIALLFALLSAAAAAAQEDDAIQLGELTTTARAALRLRPSGTAAVVATLPARTRLAWVAGQRRNGFVRVLTARGLQGWVPEASTRVVGGPPGTTLLLAAVRPCAPNLDDCAPDGCAAPDTPHALFNRTKRRLPAAGTPRRLSFADFRALQTRAAELVGQGRDLSAAKRATLRSLRVAQGTVREGSLVALNGFIAAGGEPRANSGESVNCNRTADADNDFHITLVQRSGQDEFAGIVVEMVPQQRPAGWTLSKLRRVQSEGRRVLVEGALFYDNKHAVNDDPDNPLRGQPPRFSLWEIHPVTKFLVCPKANNSCRVTRPADWVPLENF